MSNNVAQKKYINYSFLKRLLTCQPYFVWNKTITNNLNENDDEEASIWEIDVDDAPLEYAEVLKTGYEKIDNFFENYILKLSNYQNKKIHIIREKNNEIAFKKTMAAIYDESIDWIINPVFIHDDLIAKPILYRKDSKTISSLIFSSTLKRINYIQAYFEVNVIKEINKKIKKNNPSSFANKLIQINEYTFFVFDKKYTYINIPALNFIETSYCPTSKEGKSDNFDSKNSKSILEIINSGIVYENKKNTIGFFHSFDWYINKIYEAKNINVLEKINDLDVNQPWDYNPEFNDIFPYNDLKIPKISGTILRKKQLFSIYENPNLLNEYINKNKQLKLIFNKQNHIFEDIVINQIEQIKNKKCVWFDFEGFSLPYVIYPFCKPHQQFVFQVSVIKTTNDEIIEKDNLVIDPKTLNLKNFLKIVDSIYDENYEKYIVYNKGYEHNKLKEIQTIISNEIKDEKIRKSYNFKINEIINKTFDLLDLFKKNINDEKIPAIFLNELNGFSSIKKIENYITTHNISLPIMIKPYNSLNVQNGLMAMNKAVQRYLDVIGDIEWKKVTKELAEYCENDVKAMIMTYHFIIFLLNKKEKYFNDNI